MAEESRKRKPKKFTHTYIDYKDTAGLRRFLSAQGKIHSRKRNRTDAKTQRRIQRAVKKARYMGLLSYTG